MKKEEPELLLFLLSDPLADQYPQLVLTTRVTGTASRIVPSLAQRGVLVYSDDFVIY